MSPAERFVDTGFWSALVNRDDDFHAPARVLNARLRGSFVTTEAILLEIGDTFSRLRWRELGRALLREICAGSRCDVVPLTSSLLDRAMELYGNRADKEWA